MASFKKTLIASGLAAVLVGCGSGSGSTTRMGNGDHLVETQQQKDAKAASSELEEARRGLSSETPTDGQIKTVRDAIEKLETDCYDNIKLQLRILEDQCPNYKQYPLTLTLVRKWVGIDKQKRWKDDSIKKAMKDLEYEFLGKIKPNSEESYKQVFCHAECELESAKDRWNCALEIEHITEREIFPELPNPGGIDHV